MISFSKHPKIVIALNFLLAFTGLFWLLYRIANPPSDLFEWLFTITIVAYAPWSAREAFRNLRRFRALRSG